MIDRNATPVVAATTVQACTPATEMSRESTLTNEAEAGQRGKEAVDEAEKGEQDVIFVDWDGPDDPENPLNWSPRRKWLISIIGIMFSVMASLSVSGYSIGLGSVINELHTSRKLAVLGITTFTITFGAVPLLLAPFSEVYGRSKIYFISALIFTLFFIPQALATNIETILITRLISGAAGSSAVSLVGGTLADVFRGPERGFPMAIFSFGAFAATGLGPVMFGYVEMKLGFRYIQWIMLGISGVFTVTMLFCLDETRASVLLSRKAARLRKETGDDRYQSQEEYERGSLMDVLKTSLGRPVRMLYTEPVLIAFTFFMSYTWGVLYILLVAVPIVFTSVFGFNVGESGLTFSAQIVGACLGLGVDHYCEKLYHRHVDKRGPEARLYNTMVGGVCVPVGVLIFTFTSYPGLHWIGSCIGITCLYLGLFLIYQSCFSYIADSYTLYASSALSAMSFFRNLVGSVFPLFTTSLYNKLGVQGAGGLTAGLSALLAMTPFLLYRYGARLRARSPFAQELAALTLLKEEKDARRAALAV